MKRRKIIYLILILVVTGCIFGNNKESGHDEGYALSGDIIGVDGLAIEGVIVELIGEKIANIDTTDTNGFYLFGKIANGDYIIKYKKDNYSFTYDEVKIIVNGNDYNVITIIATILREVYYAVHSMWMGQVFKLAFTTPDGEQTYNFRKNDIMSNSWTSSTFQFQGGDYIEFVVEKLTRLDMSGPEIFIFLNGEKWRSVWFEREESLIKLYGTIH